MRGLARVGAESEQRACTGFLGLPRGVPPSKGTSEGVGGSRVIRTPITR
jgi:hypothetical protein